MFEKIRKEPDSVNSNFINQPKRDA